MGAELWLAGGKAACHFRRCLAPQADDRLLVVLCAVSYFTSDEGNADRTGDHAAVVVCPRALTCRQIALAIRDEVEDLEKAGVKIIQIDEPAIREGLPLRREDWAEYFNWAVETFRLASSGVRDETQIHTHMCYSEFQDILDSIAAMDADVLSVEASRSRMELLSAFIGFKYPNAIGPGVYDIHSPRVPKVEEIEDLLRRAAEVLDPAQIWVNPDCGLKTRGWKEVLPSLTAMVLAATLMRRDLQARAGVFGAL